LGPGRPRCPCRSTGLDVVCHFSFALVFFLARNSYPILGKESSSRPTFILCSMQCTFLMPCVIFCIFFGVLITLPGKERVLVHQPNIFEKLIKLWKLYGVIQHALSYHESQELCYLCYSQNSSLLLDIDAAIHYPTC
jgi:hypothetical protein